MNNIAEKDFFVVGTVPLRLLSATAKRLPLKTLLCKTRGCMYPKQPVSQRNSACFADQNSLFRSMKQAVSPRERKTP